MPPQREPDYGFVDLSAQSTPRPARPGGEDWTKTATSGVTQALAGIPGIVGDARQLLNLGALKGGAYLQSKVTGEDRGEIEKRMLQGQQDAQSGVLGKINSFIQQPTTEGIVKGIGRVGGSTVREYTGYEPATTKGKMLKTGLSFAGPSAIGPVRGLGARVASGLAGGATSEFAGESLKGSPYELPARVAGGVLGGAGGQWAYTGARDLGKGIMAPTKAAKESLGDTIGQYDVEAAGMARTMSRSPELKQAADDMSGRMREFTGNLLGIKENPQAFIDRIEDFGKQERTRVYNVARSMPTAQNIDAPQINALRDRYVFQQAEAAAIQNATGVPQWGIVPPSGKSSGNLAYYDQVKRELDSLYEQAARLGNPTKMTAANQARVDLLNILDARIPAYRDARGVASDLFKTENSVEAGKRFLVTADEYKLPEFRKAFNSYNPDQKRGFALGMLGDIEDTIKRGNPSLVANRFLKNKQFQEKLQYALGPEWYDTVRGKVLSENLIQQADKMRAQIGSAEALKGAAHPIRGKAVTAGVTGGLGAAAFEFQALAGFLQSMGVSPTSALAALGAAAAAGGKAYAMNKVDQRIANRMLQLIQSNDPKMYGEVSRLAGRNPEVYNKILAPLVAVQQMRENETEARPQRASGGRIGSKSDHLMSMVEKHRKELQAETSVLLDKPDEVIVKALKIAGGATKG
jgi:hypothetical protein